MNLLQKTPQHIHDFFQERRNNFLESLQKAASAVADDEYIKQMFQNNLSKTFIPDRICELIKQILTGDQEKYVSNLLEKLNSLEIIFGSERIEKLEEIGNHISDLFAIPILNEDDYHNQLQLISNILSDLLKENSAKNNKKPVVKSEESNQRYRHEFNLKQKTEIQSLLTISLNMKQNVLQFQKDISKIMQNANQQLKQKLSSQSNKTNNPNSEQERKELIKTIENQSMQISQLTKQVQSSSFNSNQTKDKLEKKVEKAKLIIQQLSESNEALESNQRDLEEKIEQLKETNSQLKQQLLQNSIQQNSVSPSSIEKIDLKNAEEEIDQLKEENSILKERNEKQKTKFQQRLRTLEIELQQQRESQSQIQETQLIEKDKIIEDLTNQNKILVSTIQNSEKKFLSKKQRQQKMQEMLQEISKLNEEQKSSIEQLSNENTALATTVKKLRRDLRIQKQVSDEYSQQIEELKKTFSRTEDQAKDAIELIREKLSNDSLDYHFSTLIEGIRRLFQQIDEKNTKILSLESQKQSLTSTLSNKDRENEQIQMTMQQMTEQLKNSTQLRSQYDSQQSIIDESQETIKQLHEKMEKYKKKAKDLYQSLTDVSIQRDDLLDCKELSESLKKQNLDLQKELKNAKQRLTKHELDTQTATSLSQRQYSEQLKELSRQVREANNRIQRILTQSSRSIPIESFDDIPRVFSDLKQQINKSNSIVNKLKNILQVKNDDDLINEAKNMKQDINSLQDFLKETADTLNATSLKRCSKAISELKDEIEASNQREQQICQFLLIKDPSKIEKKLQNVMEMNKIITRVVSALHVSEEDQISDKITKLTSMSSILYENEITTDEMLKNHFQHYKTLLAEKKITLEKLKGNENLEESVQQLMNHCKELEQVQKKLKISKEKPERIDLLLRCENDMNEIFNILQVQDYSEIVKTVSELVIHNNELIEEEERIMSSLAVMTPDSILPKIDDLSKQITERNAFIDDICEKLKVRDSTKLNKKINQLVAMKIEYKTAKKLLKSDNLTESVRITYSSLEELQSFITEICQILKIADANQIKPSIQMLLKENEGFHEIKVMFPIQFSGSVKDQVSKLLKMIKETKDFNEKLCQILKITKQEEIESAISSLQESQEMASELITEILRSLLANDIEINLPITADEKTRLLNIFYDNKKRNEESKRQVDFILNKAMSFGYHGESCTEAVDTIVAAFSEADKKSLSDKMHEELMLVRASSENEKKASEKQIEKYKKIIEKLKQQITELQEGKSQKENELSKQLQIEKEKMLELASDLGTQQRFNDELIQLWNQQSQNGQLSMSNLSKKNSSFEQGNERIIENSFTMTPKQKNFQFK